MIVARTIKSSTSFYNYELLMMQRKARPPWDSMLVFPGGKYDPDHDDLLKNKFEMKSNLEATAIR